MSPVSEATEPKVCQCLRTKTIYGNFAGDFETWHDGVASSASFWCLKTMGPGPDEHSCISASALAKFGVLVKG
jgi:hypothetical protein